MKLYGLYLLFAAAAVISPGPGVVMTLVNALRYGVAGTIGGILGIAFGAIIVAGVSATSLGVILAASALAFTILKLIGAAYLLYLGLKLWRAPSVSLDERAAHPASFKRRFFEGVTLQLSNPKAIFFFLSVFPQFIDPMKNREFQFLTLVCSYAALVIVIHMVYALSARRAKFWLTSDIGGRIFNKLSGCAFMGFSVALAASKR